MTIATKTELEGSACRAIKRQFYVGKRAPNDVQVIVPAVRREHKAPNRAVLGLKQRDGGGGAAAAAGRGGRISTTKPYPIRVERKVHQLGRPVPGRQSVTPPPDCKQIYVNKGPVKRVTESVINYRGTSWN